ncbi:MAG: hypothetical protein K9G59_03850 [Caulobacter sp.]|nr:hypothetical protein [Caulobacter sp.]
MTISALLLAGAMVFGQGAATDQRPYAASRTDAIRSAATQQTAQAPAPAATTVRYPSADGDILANLGRAMTAPPLPSTPPIAATFPPARSDSAYPYGTDSTGLLGGPK